MEAFYALAYLFVSDAVLVIALSVNHRKLQFPFLRLGALLLAFEFCRHVAGVLDQLIREPLWPLLLGGAMVWGRALCTMALTSSLTKLPIRWYHYGSATALQCFVLIWSFLLQTDPRVAWLSSLAPIVLLYFVSGILLILRTSTFTQGKLALASSFLVSGATLSLLGWYATTDVSLLALFYFSDSISVVLAGAMLILIALEYVREDAVAAQKEKTSSETRYRHVFQTAFDAIITVDENGVITDFNPQAHRTFGWSEEEAIGQVFTDIALSPDDRERVSRAISPTSEIDSGQVFPELTSLRKNGSTFPIELIVRSSPSGPTAKFNLFARDLSAQKKTQEERNLFEAQLQHTQKLESLGVLAGGIAHDFNNYLGGILGFAALARESVPDDSPACDDLDEIQSVARRAADLTQQLLAYSGRGQFVMADIHLSSMVRDLEPLLRSTLSKKAEITVDLARDLPVIEGDTSQLGQIIMNLATNAAEALEDATGQVTIRTGETAVSQDDLVNAYASEFEGSGSAVCLEVTDTGCGMTDDTLEHIFDPFFTTKFTGRGLGMSALIGIVRRHKGAIFVDTKVGKGTCFRVLFPVIAEAPSTPYHTPLDDDHESSEAWSAGGMVLVVDDDESVRNLAATILAKRGFDVITARDGLEGVKRFEEHADELSLVVLDLTMPKMDGAEAFERMQQCRKDVPVILSSGYNERTVFNSAIIKRAAGFLKKPYTPEDLGELARTALDSRDVFAPK